MAVITRRSSSNWIFSLKVLLASTGVLSMAMILKLSVPVVLDFLASQVPLFWTSLLSWLTPPYLYVVINGIIITIAASSRFHHKTEDQNPSAEAPLVPLLKVPEPSDVPSDFNVSSGYEAVSLRNSIMDSDFTITSVYEAISVKNPAELEVQAELISYDAVPMRNPPAENRNEFEVLDSKVSTTAAAASIDQEDDFVISRSTWTPRRKDSTEILPEYSSFSEKPPASSRFNHRHKTVKASPEGGKGLGVVKPKRHDTLESTWKTITDGRPMPLTRHLKKLETFETHGRRHHQHNSISVQQDITSTTSPILVAGKMKKSETFQDRTNIILQPSSLSPSPGSAGGGNKLRKEPSLSQDDLNRRVEAFIKKFNEEMRLQRQESLNQYNEMVNRGAH